ncbi:MAG: Sec-independent protein translocase protein TatB [Pseudomonadota bacterium]
MSLLPQFGFLELVTIAIVALVIVGPKDLPSMMRSAGRLLRQARSLAGEFTAAFDQMAREAEIEEMRSEIEALKKNNVLSETKSAIDTAIKPVEDAVRDEAAEIRDAANKPPSPGAPTTSPEAVEGSPSLEASSKGSAVEAS